MKWLKPYIHLEYPQKIFYTKNMSTFEGKNDDCKILGRIKILTNSYNVMDNNKNNTITDIELHDDDISF